MDEQTNVAVDVDVDAAVVAPEAEEVVAEEAAAPAEEAAPETV